MFSSMKICVLYSIIILNCNVEKYVWKSLVYFIAVFSSIKYVFYESNI